MAIPLSTVEPLIHQWDRIDRFITRTLVDNNVPLTSTTALEGVDIAYSPMGCGAFGCVYPTNTENNRWVVKVSLDPFEGPLSSLNFHIPNLRYHPGVAFMLGVWHLDTPYRMMTIGGPKEYEIFIILREEIQPANAGHFIDEALHRARLEAEAVNVTADDVEKGEATPEELEMYKGFFLEMVDKLDNYIACESIADYLKTFLFETGIALADIHGGNVGYRVHNTEDAGGYDHPEGVPGDYLVAFDVGASKVKPGKAPMDLLHNPGRIPVLR